jgi:hypothetical protein
VVLVADLAVVLLRPSSSFLLFRRCFFFFVSFAPSVNNVLLSLQRLRGDAGGGGLGSVLDGGRPSSSSSLRFSSALFASVSVSSFCFSRGCCRLGGKWQLVVMLVAVERNLTMPHGGYEGGSGWEAR